MSPLVAGLVLFVIVHIFTVTPRLRSLLARPGKEKLYQAGFGLTVIISIGMIIYGKTVAPFEAIWEPPLWGRHAAWLMVFIAFILFATAHGPSVVRRFLPHPMLLGVLVWALAHLLANGDLASMMMFGTFAGFSVMMMVLMDRRGAAEPVPEGNLLITLAQAAAGAALYAVILFSHPILFGVAALI